MWRKPSRTSPKSGPRPRLVPAWGLLVLAAGLAAAPPAPAQSTVTLQGRITSAEGQPLQGAQVVVRNEETGNQRGTLTASNGAYTIVGLPPGSYEVRVQMIGYGTEARQIRLLLGQRASLDFQLSQGAIALEGVAVTAAREASSFEVQRTDVSTPVVQAEIANLPLNTRNTMNLAAVVPGIKTFAPTAGRSLPSAGSLPELRFWNFYLDGGEWKSMFNGNLVGIPQTGSPIPQEAIREFRVHLNPYDAEYTRGGSYIISAVTHRGTNEVEGSGFYYFQNNDLVAHDEFQRRSRAANPSFARPEYDRQQLGFNLRGPIVRDRLFFAGSYELNNTNTAIQVVPGRPSFNPGLWDSFAQAYTAPTKNHTGVMRLTAEATDQHTVDAIWAGRVYDSETFFGGNAARDAGINAAYTIHSLQLRDTYVPTASLQNELSVHLLYWNHNESPLVPGPQLQYPSLIRTGRSTFPLELQETHLRLMNKVTFTPGNSRHLLNGGVELARVSTDSYQPSNQNGLFEFRTDSSSAPFRATIGLGHFDPTSTEDARAVTDGWITGLYLQDRWQATDRLTLTLGLRWDAEINTLNNDFTVPWASDAELRARPELQAFLNEGDRENDLNNFSPRFSFSFDATGQNRTFVRGGAGIMYDRTATFIAFNEKVAAGWRTYEIQNPGTTDPAVLRQRIQSGAGSSTPNLVLINDRMETPQNRQMSLGFGHQFSPLLSMNLDYVNQRATNLYVSTNANYFIPSQSRRAITSRFGNIILWDDFGEATFESLVGSFTFQREQARVNLAYTLGWYESTFDGSPAQNFPFSSSYELQRSTGDERHRAALSWIAPLPYGFQLSGLAIAATPTPFGVTVGQDLNNNNVFTDDFPDDLRTRRPDSGWDAMYRTVDLRLTKEIPAGPGRVSASLEAFNIFNWTNYSGYAGRMRDASGNPLTNFAQPIGVYAPRMAQVGLRYSF